MRPSARQLSWGLLYGVGILILIWIVKEAQVERLVAAFAAANWWLVGVASLLFGVNELLNAYRWIFLFRAVHPSLAAQGVLTSYLTNAFFSGLTPAKAGEALAPLLLKTRCGLPLSLGVAVVLLTRVLDLAVLAVLAPAVAWYLSVHVADSGSLPLGLAATAVAVATGCAVLWWVLGRSRRWLGKENGAAMGDSRFSSVKRRLSTLRADLEGVLQLQILGMAFLLTIASWCVLVVRVHCLINAFTPVPFFDNLVCQIVSLVAALISMIPDGVGVTAASYAWLAAKMGHDWQAIVAAGVVGLFSTHVLRLLFALPGDLWAPKTDRPSS